MKNKELRVVLDLHRATHQLGLLIETIKGIHVTQAEAIILAYLQQRRAATMSELHRAFGHKRSTLTSVVDRLVAQGFATRTVSPDDRRSFVVSLTPRGAALGKAIHDRLLAFELEALKGVSDRDIVMLRKVVARFAPH